MTPSARRLGASRGGFLRAGAARRAFANPPRGATIPGRDGTTLEDKVAAFVDDLRNSALPRLAPRALARPSLAFGGAAPRAPFTLDVFPSAANGWRQRAEFRVWRDKTDMLDRGLATERNRKFYVMFKKNPDGEDVASLASAAGVKPAVAVPFSPVAAAMKAVFGTSGKALVDPNADADAIADAIAASEGEISPSATVEPALRSKSWLRRQRRKLKKKKPLMQRVEIVPGTFTVGDALINDLMRVVLDAINSVGDDAELLSDGIYTCMFRTALDRESPAAALVTLVYRRPIAEETWRAAARRLRDAVRREVGVEVNIMGRARKQMYAVDVDYVEDRLVIARAEPLPLPLPQLDSIFAEFGMWPQARNERTHWVASFEQPDQVFSQPNARIAQEMMSWVVRATTETSLRRRVGEGWEWERVPASTLLEMYAGAGTFSVALAGATGAHDDGTVEIAPPAAPLFEHFRATETAPRAVEAATRNFWANELDVDVLRLSGADTANAVLRPSMSYPNPHVAKESTAAWMDYVSEGDGSMLLVDPPRSGLDDTSLELITSGRFDRVLYVSCNQKTLMRDLRAVARSQPFSASGGGGGLEEKTTTTHVGFPYVLAKAALFDQFPATPHAECAVLLVRSQHTGERL